MFRLAVITHLDMLPRELKLNLKAFGTVQKSKKVNYDKLLSLLKNERVQKARKVWFAFSTIKRGDIEAYHIRDERNGRYLGKECVWLFKRIDKKFLVY